MTAADLIEVYAKAYLPSRDWKATPSGSSRRIEFEYHSGGRQFCKFWVGAAGIGTRVSAESSRRHISDMNRILKEFIDKSIAHGYEAEVE